MPSSALRTERQGANGAKGLKKLAGFVSVSRNRKGGAYLQPRLNVGQIEKSASSALHSMFTSLNRYERIGQMVTILHTLHKLASGPFSTVDTSSLRCPF